MNALFAVNHYLMTNLYRSTIKFLVLKAVRAPVMKYDDNRQKLQKQMTDILADLV